jgi:hypothetical protein
VTRRRRRLAIRLCELVAVVAVQLSIVVLITTHGDSNKPRARSASLGTRAQATVTPSPTRARHRAPRRPARTPVPLQPNCTQKGITASAGKEGTCIDDNGHRVMVVNRASELRLNEMDVTMKPIRVSDVVGRGVYRLPADGAYVIVTLTVRNKLKRPALFRPEELSLLLGPSTFTHDSAAESVDPRSFLSLGELIRPGRTLTGRVIFDVPQESVQYLTIDGNVVVAQFRDLDYTYAFETVGYFRTYR